MADKPIREVIADSSIGASAWCGECGHPDLLHEKGLGCYHLFTQGDQDWTCSCQGFRPMTREEWLARR